MIEIKELDRENYSGKRFTLKYQTKGYYDIRPSKTGFNVEYQLFDGAKEMSFDDVFFVLSQCRHFARFHKDKLPALMLFAVIPEVPLEGVAKDAEDAENADFLFVVYDIHWFLLGTLGFKIGVDKTNVENNCPNLKVVCLIIT